METKRLNKKLDDAEKEYTHPDDVEYIDGLRRKISDASRRSQFHSLEMSKKIAAFLKQRVKDIKIRLSSEVGMEKVDNLALHARREENEKLLAFFVDDPVKEVEEIEKEIDGFLQT